MPSTFTQNLGLEKPATGEQAGVWGFTVNNGYDFIDMAIEGMTMIALAASTFTLDTGGAGGPSEGVAANGRAKLIIWTGTLPSAATINIVPTTSQKLFVMRNETGGGFPLQFTQGTGGVGFTLEALHDAWVYADGHGTVGPACDDPQFAHVLVTGSLVMSGRDATVPIPFTVVDPTPAGASLAYGSPATMSIEMTTVAPGTIVELAISAFSGSVWMQARGSDSTPWPMLLNPLGGGLWINSQSAVNTNPAAMLTVNGNIRMTGQLSAIFYQGYTASQAGGVQITGAGDGIPVITPTDNAGNPISAAIRFGGFGLNNFNNNVVSLAVSGSVVMQDYCGIGYSAPVEPLVIANWGGWGQIRLAYGGYGAFLRQDGANFSLGITAPGNPYGGWAIIPLQVALGTSAMGIYAAPQSGFALNVAGNINISGGYYVNGAPLSTQSPWTVDIDAASHSLANVNVATVTTLNASAVTANTVTANTYRTGGGAYQGTSGQFPYARPAGIPGFGVLEFNNGLFVGGS